MHAAYTSPASPHTAPPRGTSMVVSMAAVCAVAGCSDASLELEPLLQSTGRGSRDSAGERESGKVTESDREGPTHACTLGSSGGLAGTAAHRSPMVAEVKVGLLSCILPSCLLPRGREACAYPQSAVFSRKVSCGAGRSHHCSRLLAASLHSPGGRVHSLLRLEDVRHTHVPGKRQRQRQRLVIEEVDNRRVRVC